MASQGAKVVRADYSLPSLQKTKAKDKQLIALCTAGVNNLPIKRDACNGVICFGVAQALENYVMATQELANVVKPRRQVWIDALNGWCIPHIWERFSCWIHGRPKHLRYESHLKMEDIMKNTNLINIKLYWLPILPSRWSRYQWLVENRLAR